MRTIKIIFWYINLTLQFHKTVLRYTNLTLLSVKSIIP